MYSQHITFSLSVITSMSIDVGVLGSTCMYMTNIQVTPMSLPFII